MHENLVVLGGVLENSPQYYEGTEGKDTIGRCTFFLTVITIVKEKKYVMRVNMIAWGKLANDIMRDYEKGNYIAIRGALNVRAKPQSDGSTKWITEVIIENILS